MIQMVRIVKADACSSSREEVHGVYIYYHLSHSQLILFVHAIPWMSVVSLSSNSFT